MSDDQATMSETRTDGPGGCIECKDGVWVCSSLEPPTCGGWGTMDVKKPPPDWDCTSCLYLLAGDYHVYCRAGKCGVQVVPKQNGSPPKLGRGWKYSGDAPGLKAGWYALYCKKGGMQACRAAVAPLESAGDCPKGCG